MRIERASQWVIIGSLLATTVWMIVTSYKGMALHNKQHQERMETLNSWSNQLSDSIEELERLSAQEAAETKPADVYALVKELEKKLKVELADVRNEVNKLRENKTELLPAPTPDA